MRHTSTGKQKLEVHVSIAKQQPGTVTGQKHIGTKEDENQNNLQLVVSVRVYILNKILVSFVFDKEQSVSVREISFVFVP